MCRKISRRQDYKSQGLYPLRILGVAHLSRDLFSRLSIKVFSPRPYWLVYILEPALFGLVVAAAAASFSPARGHSPFCAVFHVVNTLSSVQQKEYF